MTQVFGKITPPTVREAIAGAAYTLEQLSHGAWTAAGVRDTLVPMLDEAIYQADKQAADLAEARNGWHEERERAQDLEQRCGVLLERVADLTRALARAYAWLGETNECALPEAKSQNFLAMMHEIEAALHGKTE